MSEHDSSGYLANKSTNPDDWRRACPEMPTGIVVNRNTIPPGMLMVYNYLEPAFCRALVAECDAHTGTRQSVTDINDTSRVITNDERTSDLVDTRALSTDVTGLIRNAYEHVIAPHFGQEMEWFELPQILRYKPGGEYKPHADSENWVVEDKQWRRDINRDLSVLLYINDDYSGGEIVFPNFGVGLKPAAGMLVAFPSDHRYVHTARPVTAGIRYAIVSWGAVKGGPRMDAGPPSDIIRL
jgi:predicted 2-oxoglutarate/Fe(II)-dependent dioxygenase YbiX